VRAHSSGTPIPAPPPHQVIMVFRARALWRFAGASCQGMMAGGLPALSHQALCTRTNFVAETNVRVYSGSSPLDAWIKTSRPPRGPELLTPLNPALPSPP